MILFFLQAKVAVYGGLHIGGSKINQLSEPEKKTPAASQLKIKNQSAYKAISHISLGSSWIMSEGIISLEGILGSSFINKEEDHFSHGFLWGGQVALLYRITNKIAFGVIGGVESQHIKLKNYEFFFDDKNEVGTISNSNKSSLPTVHWNIGLRAKYSLNDHIDMVLTGQYIQSLSRKIAKDIAVSKAHPSNGPMWYDGVRFPPINQKFHGYRVLVGMEIKKEIF